MLPHLRTIWECLEKKGEKDVLFVVVVVVESPSCKYKAGSYIAYLTMGFFCLVGCWGFFCCFFFVCLFFSGLKEISNYSFMKKTTASGNLNLQ